MSKNLHISDDVKLPAADFVTTTQAILAKRGVGKSYTAAVQAEEILRAQHQVIAIDPTGAWWGLKSSADGKSAGHPIVVFGGEHADVPLEETAGETIATAIVEHRFSAIIDLSLLRKGAALRFMGPFCETLYRLNREALHLFVDEADVVAPQKPFGEEARVLGAMEDIVRRGRIKGIGCTLITQRPAVLNKNVLTQCELLTALRLVHPRDIDAVMEWVNVHGDPAVAKQMTESLPGLPVGTAWMWCPAWELFKKVRIRTRATFDSGATPKAGQTIKPPKVLAAVDVERLGEQIKATVQRVKDNDPKTLRAELVKLRAELARAQQVRPAPAPAPKEKRVEVPAVKDQQIQRLERLSEKVAKDLDRLVDAVESLRAPATELRDAVRQVKAPPNLPGAATTNPAPIRPRLVVPSKPAPAVLRAPAPMKVTRFLSTADGETQITPAQQKVLDALAWWEMIGPRAVDRQALAVMAGYTVNGHFNNLLGSLRTLGLIDYPGGGEVCFTDAGRAMARVPDTPATLQAVHDAWRAKLTPAQWKIIEVLIGSWPASLEKEELAPRAGYTVNGHFNNLVGSLRSLGAITKRGAMSATELLFPDALTSGEAA